MVSFDTWRRASLARCWLQQRCGICWRRHAHKQAHCEDNVRNKHGNDVIAACDTGQLAFHSTSTLRCAHAPGTCIATAHSMLARTSP